MEEIEDYLNEDASPDAREAARSVRDGLAELRLRRAVQTAAGARRRHQRNATLRKWLLGALLVLSCGLLYFVLSPKQQSPSPVNREVTDTPSAPSVPDTTPASPLPPEEPAREEVQPEELIEIPETLPPGTPLADNTPPPPIPDLAPPIYAAPRGGLRGTPDETDELQALLNQLWYVDYPFSNPLTDSTYLEVDRLLRERQFPRAFVRLRGLERNVSPNDTLKLLRAYTALEMGRGQDANALLDQLEAPGRFGRAKVNWYRALGYLQVGKREEALLIFTALADNGETLVGRRARKAVSLLE